MIDVSSNFLSQVSKPIMEKKRRARINKCLDQLKSLLESYYSTSVSAHRLELKHLRIGFDILYSNTKPVFLSQIRKRKLEKADILELTVNHLRNLQKMQTCKK